MDILFKKVYLSYDNLLEKQVFTQLNINKMAKNSFNLKLKTEL
jgi:hypothetical protein